MEKMSVEDGTLVNTVVDEETPVPLDEYSLERKINTEEPQGSTLGALGNLSNTILGFEYNFLSNHFNLIFHRAGMLGLPFAVHSAGLILGGILLVIAVMAAIFGLHLLSKAAKKVPLNEEGYKTSYFAVASIVSPNFIRLQVFLLTK